MKKLLSVLLVISLMLGIGAGVSLADGVSSGAVSGLLLNFDYTDEVTYVIGHKSPDSDTAMSAIALANLLSSLGVNAEARLAGKPNSETQYALEQLGIAAPEILTDATDTQLFLVDHSEYTQAVDNADKARIVGIVDHHGVGSVSTTQMINVLSAPAGATASLVWGLYALTGTELSPEIASVLMVGIMSDTNNMSSDVTPLDVEAMEALSVISTIEDKNAFFAGMSDASVGYYGFSDKEIYYSDYKEYVCGDYRYGIGCISATDVDKLFGLAQRMETVMCEEIEASACDFLIYMVTDVGYEEQYVGYAGKDADKTEQLLDEALLNLAASYDHGEYSGYYFLKPSVSRKKVIVPAIDAVLGK